jgi:hypothetical protein
MGGPRREIKGRPANMISIFIDRFWPQPFLIRARATRGGNQRQSRVHVESAAPEED